MTLPTDPTTVWIVEDNPAYRRALARELNATPGLVCAAAFATAEEAIAAAAAGPAPEILLLDIGLPGMSGLDAIPKFRAAAPAARVVVLTVFEDDQKIARAVRAGASGYLLKLAPVDEITARIREVRAGGATLDAKVTERVLGMLAAPAAPAPADYGLTDRERAVLARLVRGLSKKQAAADLGVSEHTVHAHIRSVYDKLGVHTRSQAVAKAVRENLG
ncbi:family transcriptional regulator : Two component transcriptional regulator, LuxR family OS=Chthoniobacter flavus Ellin428 GN=CfE428DRAFT_3520 PE=4 SV=1: Response_reg: GerE [Gemmataceae bacterium]|nr:family transcriptional regulator : Two component transcriptional regulator, LuxR family OS=Chthoniobacter flavus Ellin428 GN=CfE428DRAFT_3520 PE=4 SV=1: Response_reg: GerE [Gemmataceae bacterium]VTT97618.1 family transcriptional regulator : Two component transcriptional regulator, LuxR family OS=Chthoniobacter flavus Ellin428 GN=CfE428DRAFT_3520 PE=4 SV=1: Response_reg: GerE [Gemmataceae bacterium]